MTLENFIKKLEEIKNQEGGAIEVILTCDSEPSLMVDPGNGMPPTEGYKGWYPLNKPRRVIIYRQ